MSSDLIALKNYLGCREDFSDTEIAFIHKTQHYARKVAWIPGLRMMAICNSIAMKNADDESDIDLFVVTEPGRMWVVRCFLTLAFQAMGVRRYGKKTTGRFCLSFYATTEGMDLSSVALKANQKSKIKNLNEGIESKSLSSKFSVLNSDQVSSSCPNLDFRNQNLEFLYEDPYLAYWCQTLLPIYDRGNMYEKFVDINRLWVPDLVAWSQQAQFLVDPKWANSEVFFVKKSLDILERLIRSLWLPLTLRTWRGLGKPRGVVISDNMLKFHPRDKRLEIQQALKWNVHS